MYSWERVRVMVISVVEPLSTNKITLTLTLSREYAGEGTRGMLATTRSYTRRASSATHSGERFMSIRRRMLMRRPTVGKKDLMWES